MADTIIATVSGDEETFVSVQEQSLSTATSELYNPASVPRLGDVGDVDATDVINGSVLVYKTTTNKWTSTINLDAQDMDGGEF